MVEVKAISIGKFNSRIALNVESILIIKAQVKGAIAYYTKFFKWRNKTTILN
ncbi:MAG: hypothetical protein V7K21_24740 [Nostoc sp.]|uniref:hypothetical protein n=1 Tax=Nostoc sp. TaxID=1180 RepID=UPI002FF97EDB